jgi:thioredoxin-related protein
MKILVIAFLIICFIPTEWLTDIALAKEAATKENRMILLNFSGSDWCAPCIKMKRDVFESEVIKQYAEENLVLLRADFPRLKKNQPAKEQVQHNEALAEKYNAQGKFPFTVLLDAKGTVIKEWDGYSNQTPEDFVKQLQAVITK